MRRKPLNEMPRPCAAMMFCGLPMMVPAEPAFAAKQNPRRKGTGLRPRDRVMVTSNGVIATTTTSLVSTADSSPPTVTRIARRTGAETGRVATRWAAHP